VNCDFSLSHYEYILDQALSANYSFCSYDELEKINVNACVLRHDIDYTPERALSFAKIESERSISAYYFFLINSPIYNLRDKNNYRIVHDLVGLGHKVGLHYDPFWSDHLKFEDIAADCKNEKMLFHKMTNQLPCEIISFHNTHQFQNLIVNKSIPEIVHTYEARFFSDVKYLSDSQGWYEGCICSIFREKRYQKIQLLTHPYIWSSIPREDFIGDMANVILDKGTLVLNYMIVYHPVCRKNTEKLINNVSKVFANIGNHHHNEIKE
jgi:hypothetical protein